MGPRGACAYLSPMIRHSPHAAPAKLHLLIGIFKPRRGISRGAWQKGLCETFHSFVANSILDDVCMHIIGIFSFGMRRRELWNFNCMCWGILGRWLHQIHDWQISKNVSKIRTVHRRESFILLEIGIVMDRRQLQIDH
jgi:hypothetical protein